MRGGQDDRDRARSPRGASAQDQLLESLLELEPLAVADDPGENVAQAPRSGAGCGAVAGVGGLVRRALGALVRRLASSSAVAS